MEFDSELVLEFNSDWIQIGFVFNLDSIRNSIWIQFRIGVKTQFRIWFEFNSELDSDFELECEYEFNLDSIRIGFRLHSIRNLIQIQFGF